MARSKKGVLDNSISGSIGGIVFTSRNGVPYMRSKPAHYRDAKTPAQLASRMKLGMLSGLLKVFMEVLKKGFKNPPPGKSYRDVAYRTNANGVILGEYPDMRIDYTAFRVSAGPVDAPTGCVAHIDDGELKITWDSKSPINRISRPTDRIMVVIFNEENNHLIWEPYIAKRIDGTVSITLPNGFLTNPGPSDQKPHLWLCFHSVDDQQASDSTYVEVQVKD